MIKIIENGNTYIIATEHILSIRIGTGMYRIETITSNFYEVYIKENPELENYVKGVLGK